MTGYLHENSEKFRDKVIDIANSSGRAESIVEKDYYLTNLLETISMNTPLVFKGGTSLSKGHNIINRFSEDIDFCVPEHLTRGERRNVRDVIVDAIESMGLLVQDKDNLQSGSRFNKYIAPYHSIDEEPIVFPKIMIETNMVQQSLLHHVIPIDGFDGVKQFNADTQDIEETFVEKLFAICDYFMENKPYRNSRHLYDIYQMSDKVDLSVVNDIIPLVRKNRAADLVFYPSAADDVDIRIMISEILSSDYYKSDYNNVTTNLLYDDVSYTSVKEILSDLLSKII